MRELPSGDRTEEKGSSFEYQTAVAWNPHKLSGQLLIHIVKCSVVAVALLPPLWLASTLIYLLGFKYLGSLSGLPMHWSPVIIEFWIIVVMIVQVLLVGSLCTKVFGDFPSLAGLAGFVKHVATGLGRTLLAFLLIPALIVGVVTLTTLCVLYLLLPLAVNLGLPIKYHGQMMSTLCPMIALPQFIAAFAIQLWVYYPSMPKAEAPPGIDIDSSRQLLTQTRSSQSADLSR